MSGHDFSRAETGRKHWALAPAAYQLIDAGPSLKQPLGTTPTRERPLRLGGAANSMQPFNAGSQAEQLPAEAFMSTVKSTIEVPIKPTVITHHRPTEPNNGAIPESRNPVAVRHISGRPDISGARAGWNVCHRSAHTKSKFSGLRRLTQTGHAGQHRCTQHPIPHATHNPSVPAVSVLESGPASVR